MEGQAFTSYSKARQRADTHSYSRGCRQAHPGISTHLRAYTAPPLKRILRTILRLLLLDSWTVSHSETRRALVQGPVQGPVQVPVQALVQVQVRARARVRGPVLVTGG